MGTHGHAFRRDSLMIRLFSLNKCLKGFITLFIFKTSFYGTNNVMQNILHIQTELLATLRPSSSWPLEVHACILSTCHNTTESHMALVQLEAPLLPYSSSVIELWKETHNLTSLQQLH